MSVAIKVDAVVIGGGIVGASAAMFLAKSGQRVVLLERDFSVLTPVASTTAACVARAALFRSCRCRNGLTPSGAT